MGSKFCQILNKPSENDKNLCKGVKKFPNPVTLATTNAPIQNMEISLVLNFQFPKDSKSKHRH